MEILEFGNSLVSFMGNLSLTETALSEFPMKFSTWSCGYMDCLEYLLAQSICFRRLTPNYTMFDIVNSIRVACWMLCALCGGSEPK